MGRSPGFGSTSTNYSPYSDSLSLRLRISCLTSLVNVTRRSVLQKVRHHTLNGALTACKHMVSGSVSLPSRGSFHLSFTVLFAIGHWVVFRLGGWSPRLPTGFLVSRGTQDTSVYRLLSLTGLLPSAVKLSSSLQLAYFQLVKSYNPRLESLVWALPSSLAATGGIEFSFSSSGY